MPGTAELAHLEGVAQGPVLRELLVVRQDEETRAWLPVGRLRQHPDGYSFGYVRDVLTQEGFVPLLGYRDVHELYRSASLAPLFSQRVMSDRRGDRVLVLEGLDLLPDSSPMDFLAATHGEREGDHIRLFEVPEPEPDGSVQLTFLVHGIRHVGGADSRALKVHAGEALDLRPEPDNEHNDQALLVVSGDEPLGYVPDVLLPYVHRVLQHEGWVLRAVRASGPGVSVQRRLLVRLEGRLEAVGRDVDDHLCLVAGGA